MPNFFEDVIVRLAKEQVEFVVVGGVSATLQGAPIVTFDLDICCRRKPENLSRTVRALAELCPRPRDFPADLPFAFDERTLLLGTNFTFVVEGGDLDLLGEMSGIGGYDEIIVRAAVVDLAGYTIKVLSLADLIRTKEAAGRPKDLAVLPVLRATLDMLADSDDAASS